MKEKLKVFKEKTVDFILMHKIPTTIVAGVLVVGIVAASVMAGSLNDVLAEKEVAQNNPTSSDAMTSEDSNVSDTDSQESVPEVSDEALSSSQESEPQVSSKEESTKPESSKTESASKVNSSVNSSKVNSTSSKKPTSSSSSNKKPTVNTNYKYNANNSFSNNVFLDSLTYTGYNLKKQLKDNPGWEYVLASQKRGKGWLSKIGYGGGNTGYETDKKGLPNIKSFERGGLVCASFVTYVYFNYLPNVAGIDTSSLTKPDDPHLANSWYKAAKKWVKKGYSKEIKYDVSDGHYINFKPKEDIPIGSIMCFQDYRNRNGHCSHVAIYAGYKNNNHWVFHVGNDNGPEFCSVERMKCGPDPQWTLAVISTPKNIRFSARTEVTVTDENGAPLSGVEVTLKSKSGGKTVKLGKTNSKGKATADNLVYGKYSLSYTVLKGYTATATTKEVTLNTKNNSCNTFKIKLTKVKTPTESSSESSVSSDSSSAVSSQTETESSEN